MITVTRLTEKLPHEEYDSTSGFVIVIDNHIDIGDFKKLIQRGANLWPDAPASIKGFADLITVGHVQQDYASQDTSGSAPKTKNNYHEF